VTTYTGLKNFTAYTGAAITIVKPPDFSSLPAHDSENATMNALRDILLTNCKYVIDQMPTVTTAVGTQTTSTGQHNYGARPAAEGMCGISVAISTGIWSEEITGVSQSVAIDRCKNCITAMYSTYLYCEKNAKQSWYYDWQAASWAAEFGRAVWHLWSHLSGTEKRYSAYVIESEANRILNEYTTEYWNGVGGDSYCETVAWNATILQIARSMMPQHPNVSAWLAKEIELEIAALSRPSDVSSETEIEGKAVSEWIDGYNVPQMALWSITRSFTRITCSHVLCFCNRRIYHIYFHRYQNLAQIVGVVRINGRCLQQQSGARKPTFRRAALYTRKTAAIICIIQRVMTGQTMIFDRTFIYWPMSTHLKPVGTATPPPTRQVGFYREQRKSRRCRRVLRQDKRTRMASTMHSRRANNSHAIKSVMRIWHIEDYKWR